MKWKCPRCQLDCEGDYCFNCGQQYMPEFVAKTPVATYYPSIAELKSSVKTLKIMCIVLISVVAVMTVVFAVAYFSVWENIVDLWDNAEGLWENADELWESSEALWEEQSNSYYWYY